MFVGKWFVFVGKWCNCHFSVEFHNKSELPRFLVKFCLFCCTVEFCRKLTSHNTSLQTQTTSIDKVNKVREMPLQLKTLSITQMIFNFSYHTDDEGLAFHKELALLQVAIDNNTAFTKAE